ncbi:MAG TPA: hypothetical protein VFX09_04965 [Burkholderiales bacterium]|nr:hypothetical protein [Burkholderiales bacterium]
MKSLFGPRRILAALCAGALCGSALAKLPPPSPEEQAKLEKAAREKAATTKKQMEELARKQEQVAMQYRAQHGMPTQLPKIDEPTRKTDVPKSAKQPLDENAHPYAGRNAKPQGQAHSASD